MSRLLSAVAVFLAFVSAAYCTEPIKALLITGQNNHNWRLSAPVLKRLLEDSGKFTVDVAQAPTKADKQKDKDAYDKALAAYKPDFTRYQVIVSDYNSCETGDDWSAETQKSFEEYMQNGGGFVSYHAADNSFPKWGEFNKVIGVAGWGRPADFGNFVYYKDGKQVTEKGHGRCGSHGPQHDFLMVVRDENHPITKGLPKEFMHGSDELYDSLQGPAENLTVQATASSNATHKDEPMLMTIQYGKGRVFHTTLGHVMSQGDLKKLADVSFITTFLRGTEWAATGQVTIPVPADFPGKDKPSYRESGKENPYPLKKVKAIVLPDNALHPDGMTIAPTGDIILAVPVIGSKGNAQLLKITKDDKIEPYFELSAHPETGRVTPLGIAFGPDGNLYVADSQCLGGNPNHKSRLLRVVHENGKPVRSEILVTGIVQANGLEIFGNKIYIAETQIDPSITDVPFTSGVFCFDISEFKSLRPRIAQRRELQPLHVLPYGEDPHFIYSFQTGKNDPKAQKVGANGIGLSKDGVLYVANFGDKKIIAVELTRNGTVKSQKDLNDGKGPNESVDGLKVCPKGYIFFADYVGNAVCVMNPVNGKTIILAKNATNPSDSAKQAGALDRCSEVCLRDGKLYVSNIDLEDTSTPHTISVFDLQGIDFDALLK